MAANFDAGKTILDAVADDGPLSRPFNEAPLVDFVEALLPPAISRSPAANPGRGEQGARPSRRLMPWQLALLGKMAKRIRDNG